MLKIAENLLEEIDQSLLFLWLKELELIAVWNGRRAVNIFTLKGYSVETIIYNRKPPPEKIIEDIKMKYGS